MNIIKEVFVLPLFIDAPSHFLRYLTLTGTEKKTTDLFKKSNKQHIFKNVIKAENYMIYCLFLINLDITLMFIPPINVVFPSLSNSHPTCDSAVNKLR
jgi:NADH:ubiquinone oxidoreductase subunit 3 (subunit A)